MFWHWIFTLVSTSGCISNAPAAGTNLNLNSLLHQVIDAQHDNDNLDNYEIMPIALIETTDGMLPASPLQVPAMWACGTPVSLGEYLV